MINKKIKSLLKQEFEAPPPTKKEEFLRCVPFKRMRFCTFLWVQAAYIQKWIWVFSIFLFFTALICSCILKREILWDISAFMPILALSLITESGRSRQYGMTELEQSSCFSRKMVLFARLAVLGIENLVLSCLLIPFAFQNSGFSLAQVSAFLLCPYLLTTFLGVNILRRIRGKGADYLCICVAFCVSIGNGLLRQSHSYIYENINLSWCFFSGIFFLIGTVYQYSRMLKQEEEFIWNL